VRRLVQDLQDDAAASSDGAAATPASQTRADEEATEDGIDVVQIRPENMPNTPATSHTFWYDDPWVSNDLLLLLLGGLAADTRGLVARTSPSGAAYWTFPPDYADRIPAVRDALLARLGAP